MEEKWIDIKDYEGKYKVSNLGNVMSLNYNNTGKPRILKPKTNRYGYLEVKLSKNNKTKNFLVSTLVANAFIPNKNPDKMVCHISSDVTDNSVSNLKWCYKSEMLHNTYKRVRRKGTPSGNKISYNNVKAKNMSDLAIKLGKNPNQMRKRLAEGWTLEESFEIPMYALGKGSHKLHEYYGEYLTLRQIAEKYDKSYDLIRRRLSKGWNLYEAVDIPKLR